MYIYLNSHYQSNTNHKVLQTSVITAKLLHIGGFFNKDPFIPYKQGIAQEEPNYQTIVTACNEVGAR